jgi:hypothetical protein
MLIKLQTLEILYKISATARFNSERGEILEKLLGRVLSKGLEKVDMQKELDCLKDIDKGQKDLFSPTGVFRYQRNLAFLKIDGKRATEYIYTTYFPFTQPDLCGELGYRVASSLLVCQSISYVVGTKAKNLGFKNEVYKFNDKYEYANQSFVCIPDREYIEIWSKAITFKVDEVLKDMDNVLFNGLGEHIDIDMTNGVKEAFEQLSFTQESIQNGEPFRLEVKPLLKINTDTYVLLGNFYLLRSLLYRCETLLKDCKFYRETSGYVFERRVLTLLSDKFGSDLYPNIHYGNNYELDGLLNLKTSSWFIECASHPPDIEALFGNEVEIQEDLEKSIIHCQNQGARDIENADNEAIKRYNPHGKKGIIIVTDPYYPNMMGSVYKYFEAIAKEFNTQLPKEIKNPIPEIKYPKYIITYFELDDILSQPDSNLFEEFLEWRTQDNMPIACSDELDYWDYFTKMYGDAQREDTFRLYQKNRNIIHYIGNRFNNKHYLDKIMEKESKEKNTGS